MTTENRFKGTIGTQPDDPGPLLVLEQTPEGPRERPWRRWTALALRVLLAVVFFAAGLAKLIGATSMVAVFSDIGIGQWFRYVTGVIEIGGALMLLWSSTVRVGSALLACTMVGAILTHLFVIGGSAVPALILLTLLAVVLWLQMRPAHGK